MRIAITPFLLLLSTFAGAQKPWEARVDLAVPVPVELPAIAPLNPFASPVTKPPLVARTLLREKFVGTFPATVAAYVDTTGTCRRLVLVRAPWNGLAAELQAAFVETTFLPGRSVGGPVATWLPAVVDLKGRINEGRLLTVNVTLPDPAAPPNTDALTIPTPEKRDLDLPAMLAERLDQLPSPKRFRARINERTWRENVRFLASVGTTGKVERVVFLSCPEGLRAWLLASLGSWVFQPGQGVDGPVAVWVQVDAAVEVMADDLAADSMRVSRETLYPRVAAPPAAGPPPGA